jgi:hypothetical protein
MVAWLRGAWEGKSIWETTEDGGLMWEGTRASDLGIEGRNPPKSGGTDRQIRREISL